MKCSFRELSIVRQSILILIFFSSLFVLNAWLLFGMSKGLEHYDDLNRKLGLVENNVVRLEFTLDIFVISKHFEGDMGAAIKGYVEDIDELFLEFDKPVHASHFGGRGMHGGIAEELRSNWEKIKADVIRLDKASSAEEELLIHNDIDNTAFYLIEGVRTLTGVLEEQRVDAFEAKGTRALTAIIISFVITFFVALFFIRKTLVPVRDFFSDSRAVADKGMGFRFSGDIPGQAGVVSRALNKIMDTSNETFLKGEEVRRAAEGEMGNVRLRLDALSAMAKMFGRSLSYHEISQRAIVESLNISEAEAGAIYLVEGNKLKLSVSKGFSNTFFYKGDEIDLAGRMSSPEQLVVDPIGQYPDERFVGILKAEGIAMVVSTPIVEGDKIIGFFDIMFKSRRDIPESILFFLETVGTNVGAVHTYTALFSKEHASTAFFERVLQQVPFGVAVFDIEGLCVLSNARSKEILAGDARANLVGVYNIFSDEVFGAPETEAFMKIKRAYDGEKEDFYVEYKCGLPGQKELVRLAARTVPLYEASGDVTHILMTYEVSSQAGGPAGDAVKEEA